MSDNLYGSWFSHTCQCDECKAARKAGRKGQLSSGDFPMLGHKKPKKPKKTKEHPDMYALSLASRLPFEKLTWVSSNPTTPLSKDHCDLCEIEFLITDLDEKSNTCRECFEIIDEVVWVPRKEEVAEPQKDPTKNPNHNPQARLWLEGIGMYTLEVRIKGRTTMQLTMNKYASSRKFFHDKMDKMEAITSGTYSTPKGVKVFDLTRGFITSYIEEGDDVDSPRSPMYEIEWGSIRIR